ncbi:hypothetical protein GCM10009117_06730 [Gangjinia marincola]|uniref:Uncharacterized protein n=1 Tax=Gangjinia marincola TaxID=578463 RepID=A0ABN1MEK5_9FLAO
MKKILLPLIFLLTGQLQAQDLLPIAFEDCEIRDFIIENDVEVARKDPEAIKKIIVEHLNPRARKKLRGELMFQILVYQGGRSCLLSVDNDTKFNKDELDLETVKFAIDELLLWEDVEDKNVSAMVLLKFKRRGKVTLRRLGIGPDRDVHELKRPDVVAATVNPN